MVVKLPPNQRMQPARAAAIWYGHSMLTRVDKLPLISRSDAREPDAGRWAALRLARLPDPTAQA
jgi:hypothetical protein